MPVADASYKPLSVDEFPDPELFIDLDLERRAESIGRPLFPKYATSEERVSALQSFYNQVEGKPKGDHKHSGKTYLPSEMIGKSYNHWTVIGLSDRPGRVIARCICGTEKHVLTYNLRHGCTDSCGCQKPRPSKALTEAQEAEILASDEYNHVLAERYGVSRETIARARRKTLQGRIDAKLRTLRAVVLANEAARSRRLATGCVPDVAA